MGRSRGQILWLAIFVAGAIFQLWRDSPVDVVVYLVVALLIFLSSQSRFQVLEFQAIRFPTVALALLLAVLVFLFGSIHSWLVTVTFLMLAPMLIRIAWQRDLSALQPIDDASRRSSRIWSGIGLLACVCELGNYFASDYTHNDEAYPTITVLVDPIVANAWGKAAFVIVWAGIGTGLLRVSTKR